MVSAKAGSAKGSPWPEAGPRRRRLTLAAACVLALCAALPWLHARHVRLLAPLAGYTAPRPFDLRDSLPALEGGLTDLEAFAAHVPGARRANFDRTVWITARADSLTFDYVTTRSPHDSVRIVTWSDDPVFDVAVIPHTRAASRVVARPGPVRDWIEVVSVFLAAPQRFRMHATEPGVTRFERAEGRTLHLVRSAYRARILRPSPPDTAYPIPDTVPETSAEPELLARGNAVAILNPTDARLRLRIVFRDHTGRIHRPVVDVAPGHVHVHRTLLAGAWSTVLAYTDPGMPFGLMRDASDADRAYFLLDRDTQN